MAHTIWVKRAGRETGDIVLTDHMFIHFLELIKFRMPVQEVSSELEKWMWYYVHESEEGVRDMRVLTSEPVFKQAHEGFSEFTQDRELRELAERRELWEIEYNTDISDAKAEGIEQSAYTIFKNGLISGTG